MLKTEKYFLKVLEQCIDRKLEPLKNPFGTISKQPEKEPWCSYGSNKSTSSSPYKWLNDQEAQELECLLGAFIAPEEEPHDNVQEDEIKVPCDLPALPEINEEEIDDLESSLGNRIEETSVHTNMDSKEVTASLEESKPDLYRFCTFVEPLNASMNHCHDFFARYIEDSVASKLVNFVDNFKFLTCKCSMNGDCTPAGATGVSEVSLLWPGVIIHGIDVKTNEVVVRLVFDPGGSSFCCSVVIEVKKFRPSLRRMIKSSFDEEIKDLVSMVVIVQVCMNTLLKRGGMMREHLPSHATHSSSPRHAKMSFLYPRHGLRLLCS